MMAIRALLLAGMVAMCAAVNHDVLWKVALENKTMAVKCGDTITLSWGKGFTHNLYKSDKGSCDGKGADELEATSAGGKHVYTVTKTDTEFYFICLVGQHCTKGQKLSITSTCSGKTTTNTTTTTTPTKKTNSTSPATPTKGPATTTSPAPSSSPSPKTNTTTNTTKKSAASVPVSFNAFFVAVILGAVGVLML